MTDTIQMKGATAFDDRSQKNQTPEGLAQAYPDPAATSTETTDLEIDVAVAETALTSQPTIGGYETHPAADLFLETGVAPRFEKTKPSAPSPPGAA